MEMKTYPEINEINTVRDCNLALAMGYNCLDSLKPEYRGDLRDRLAAIEARRRRLVATEARIHQEIRGL